MSEQIDKVNESSEEELEIFGRSKSKDEIQKERREEKKARKAAEKEAAKKAAAQRREEKKNRPKATRGEILMAVIMVAVVVVVGAVMIAVPMIQEAKEEKFRQNMEFTTYFADSEAYPDMSTEGLTAAVTEAYYTNGGYLCLQLLIGNGTDVPQTMESIEAVISNGESEKEIASGYTANISNDFMVPVGEAKEYTFYISPEHVTIHDDPLTTISYTITITGSHGE